MSHSHRRQTPPQFCSSCKRPFGLYRRKTRETKIERSKLPNYCTSCYPDFLRGAWKVLQKAGNL